MRKKETLSAKVSQIKNNREPAEKRGLRPRAKTILTDFDKRFDRKNKKKDIEKELERG